MISSVDRWRVGARRVKEPSRDDDEHRTEKKESRKILSNLHKGIAVRHTHDNTMDYVDNKILAI